MYYCWKCRTWHKHGSIAQRHKIFSVPSKSKKTRVKLKVKPLAKTKPIWKPKKTKKYGLTITKKKKPKTQIKPVKRIPLRKPKTGLSLMSRSRRGQIRMRSSDIYERQMIARLRKTTKMTHIQIMNLVNLAKKSDYIDIETIISSVAGESSYPTELYEFAKRKIKKQLNMETGETMEGKYADESYYNLMMEDWKKKPSLV